MKSIIGADTKPLRKHIAVLALGLIAINSAFLLLAASGAMRYFAGYGIIPISFLLCALALLVMAGRSRRRC